MFDSSEVKILYESSRLSSDEPPKTHEDRVFRAERVGVKPRVTRLLGSRRFAEEVA